MFEKLLGPTCQFRLLRRKNLLKLGLPMGIKFVVDLSPPEEGDEAVAMIERLWCPDEILLWENNLEGYVEPDEREDVASFLNTGDINQEQGTEIETAGINATSHASFLKNSSTTLDRAPTPPSYSPTRHTAAIERVLHILHGLDPRIHTTPMWYTVHKVAVQLQCTSAVQDHILSWLYSNLDFVEHYPALVLRIAAEVQNQTLFRDAFALLVGAQLISGRIDNAGVLQAVMLDDKVPEEAEHWRKHILFARRSLQSRLKKLHDYMLSAAWLDNAAAIPEYAKLMSRLNDPTLPRRLKKLTHDLDHAIRADMKAALAELSAFSGDPSHTPVRERQIYSRVYWLETQHIAQRPPLFGDHVVKLLSGWEGSVRRVARETRERELGIDTQVEQILQYPGVVGYSLKQVEDIETISIHHQSVLEVREKHDYEYNKGKAKATSIAPDPTPQTPHKRTYNWCSTAQDTQHPKGIDKLKGIPKPSHTDRNPSSCSLSLSPIRVPESSHSAIAQLPKPGDINMRSHDDPDYLISLEPSACLLSPLRVKRKSYSDPGFWLDRARSSEQNAGSEEIYDNLVGDAGVDEMTTVRVLPRPERIEIIGPISKRRRSVERCDSNGEENAETSPELHPGEEPEVLRILGVHKALVDDHGQVVGDEDVQGQSDVMRQTGESTVKVTQVAHIDREFQDAVDNAMTDARLVPADVTAYWSMEGVGVRQVQHGNAEGETTLLEIEVPRGEEEVLEYDAEAYKRFTERKANFPVACGQHLLDEPALYIPGVLPLAAKTEESSNVQQYVPQQTIEALGAFFGDTNTPPVTYHSFTTPCPYTSIPESSTLANTNQVNTYVLWTQCRKYLKALGAKALNVPISFAPTLGNELVLVCLEDEEWQFMPLWAGGLDDGSGAVFGELAPPPLDLGEGVTKIEPGGTGNPGREGEETEVESLLGSYDDCMDVESMGSFETSGFSEFESSGSTADWSEFGDCEAQSDVEAREGSGVESLGERTAGEDGSGSDGEFEDFEWEST